MRNIYRKCFTSCTTMLEHQRELWYQMRCQWKLSSKYQPSMTLEEILQECFFLEGAPVWKSATQVTISLTVIEAELSTEFVAVQNTILDAK